MPINATYLIWNAGTLAWDEYHLTPNTHTHTTSDISNFPTLAVVATSGSYTDLSNKPTIPTIPSIMDTTEGNAGTAVTQRTINAANLKSIILYHSPAGARPASDVSSWAKAATKPAYTALEVGAAAASHGNHYPTFNSASDYDSAKPNFFRQDGVWAPPPMATPDAHSHPASAIISGVLPIERGGTGKSSWTSGQLLIGGGTSTVAYGAYYDGIEQHDATFVAPSGMTSAIMTAYYGGTNHTEAYLYDSGGSVLASVIDGSLNILSYLTAGQTYRLASYRISGQLFSSADVNITTSLPGITQKAVSDSSSASALSSSDANIPTVRDIYYGLPTINNSHSYSSNTAIFAPDSGGTAGNFLKAVGVTSTPTWAKALEVLETSSNAYKVRFGSVITSIPADSRLSVTFGSGFSTIVAISVTAYRTSTSYSGYNIMPGVQSYTTSTFYFANDGAAIDGLFYIVIGY